MKINIELDCSPEEFKELFRVINKRNSQQNSIMPCKSLL